MANKGAGYDAVEVVKQAIAVAEVSPETFFAGAQHFTRTNGYDPTLAALRFKSFMSNPAVEPDIPPAVTTFADWVLTKDARTVTNKFQSFPKAKRKSH